MLPGHLLTPYHSGVQSAVFFTQNSLGSEVHKVKRQQDYGVFKIASSICSQVCIQ